VKTLENTINNLFTKKLEDKEYYNSDGTSGSSKLILHELFEKRKGNLWDWVNDNEKDCEELGVYKSDYAFGPPSSI